ncbi:MAG: GMC family oxidoreductase [Acidimicrobiales bacterium]
MTLDAVVIGSGPGGAAAADVLTRAGWSVLIVEKGRNHLLDPDDPTRPAGDYSNDEIKFLYRHFLGPDPLVEPRTFRRDEAEGDRTHVGEVNSIPSTVGGGGTHADGKVPRFQEDDFRLLSALGPQPDAHVADWPLTYDDLEPYYAAAERSVGVAGDAGANPFAAWRSGPYPMPPGAPMYASTISAAAAERLGYHPYAAPTAANSVPYDGRPACNNCGFCAFFGCPIHAKGDPIALLQRAMATGRAELWAETFVSRVRTDGGRATGVDVVGPDGAERSVDARHVVVAGGAVETPRLLLLSGIGNDLVGRYLMVHYQTIVAGTLPGRLHGERGRAVTHVHDDHIVGDELTRAAAREAGLPWLRGGMVEHGTPALPIMEAKVYPWGPKHPRLMRSSPLRARLAAFTMQGEDLPYPTNRVDLDPAVRDARGFPVARVTYRGGRHELAASAHHGPRLEAVLEEMGATWTSVSTSPGVGHRGGETPVPESRHVMGTTRMGTDPATSVVDPWGRVHGLENVVVVDSSVFVTSAGYGPTLTLVALAARAAAAMAGTELPAAGPPGGGTVG